MGSAHIYLSPFRSSIPCIIWKVLYGPGQSTYKDLMLELNRNMGVFFWKTGRTWGFLETLVNGSLPEDTRQMRKCDGMVQKHLTQKMLL